MERKLVKQGSSTMTMSLPSNWVKKFDLNQDDVVELQEVDNSLVVSTSKTFKSQELKIEDSAQRKGYLFRRIIGLYQSGYDKIIVKHNNQERYIIEITNQLIGYVLMKKSDSKCVIEDLSGVANINFEDIYKRCFSILVEQYETLLLKLENDEDLTGLNYLDYNLNQFSDFCLRYLSKRGHENFRKTPLYYHVVSQIELMGDIMTKFDLLYDDRDKKEVVRLLRKIVELIRDFQRFSFNIKNDKNSDIIDACKKIERRYMKLSSSSSMLQIVQIATIIKDLFNTILVLKD